LAKIEPLIAFSALLAVVDVIMWMERVRVRWLPIMLIGMGVILALVSAAQFWTLPPGTVPTHQPWTPFYLSGLCWIIGCWLALPQTATAKPRLTSWAWLVALLVIALVLRVYGFGVYPYGVWHDEAGAGLNARFMLESSDYRPIYIGGINVTAPHLMLYALLLDLFGYSIWSMRLLSIAFGVLAVVVGFLLGREVHGDRFGLLVAGFVAVSRWAIHFSHIAMTGIDVVFFNLLAVYLLLRLLRTRALRDALMLGVAVGGGLWFYMPFRAVVLALALVTPLVWRPWRRRDLLLLTLTGVTVLIVLHPLMEYAVLNPEAFWTRVNFVSIFSPSERTSPTLGEALVNNTLRYLLMFHVQGDVSGLRNLPNAPMLDPVSGLLVVIGGLLLIARLRKHAAYPFLGAVFVVSLLSGILTSEAFAPHAGRTIGVLATTSFCCALAVYTLTRRLPARTGAVLQAGMIGLVTLINANGYFNGQLRDFFSWHAFASQTRLLSESIQMHDQDGNALLISERLWTADTLNFLVPKVFPRLRQGSIEQLLTEVPPPFTLFIDDTEPDALEAAQALYPQAQIEAVRPAYPMAETPPDRISFYVVSVENTGDSGNGDR
jgi:4-amino-4-deoxy-L-arabinose transferase-like glycosyltransferase